MKAFVVDVNVAIVANGKAPQANLDCRAACIDALEFIAQKGRIVLDDARRILSEYQNNLSPSGQPGLGDAFMQWVWENQSVQSRCEQVSLTPINNPDDDFNEFPRDVALTDFDRSDRKYVAVALASSSDPEVLNAVDPDWWEHKTALEKNGLHINFLCPQHMQ